MDFSPYFLNVEYIFYLIYRFFVSVSEFLFGAGGGNSGDGKDFSDANAGQGSGDGLISRGIFERENLADSFGALIDTIFILAKILTILFIAGIIYCLIRIQENKKKFQEVINTWQPPKKETKLKDERLMRIEAHLLAGSDSEMRLAIIEADALLEEILAEAGYTGEGVGERLKNLNKGALSDAAWEAHRVRNRIAHEGSRFVLTKEEANKTVNLYKKVYVSLDKSFQV